MGAVCSSGSAGSPADVRLHQSAKSGSSPLQPVSAAPPVSVSIPSEKQSQIPSRAPERSQESRSEGGLVISPTSPTSGRSAVPVGNSSTTIAPGTGNRPDGSRAESSEPHPPSGAGSNGLKVVSADQWGAVRRLLGTCRADFQSTSASVRERISLARAEIQDLESQVVEISKRFEQRACSEVDRESHSPDQPSTLDASVPEAAEGTDGDSKVPGNQNECDLISELSVATPVVAEVSTQFLKAPSADASTSVPSSLELTQISLSVVAVDSVTIAPENPPQIDVLPGPGSTDSESQTLATSNEPVEEATLSVERVPSQFAEKFTEWLLAIHRIRGAYLSASNQDQTASTKSDPPAEFHPTTSEASLQAALDNVLLELETQIQQNIVCVSQKVCLLETSDETTMTVEEKPIVRVTEASQTAPEDIRGGTLEEAVPQTTTSPVQLIKHPVTVSPMQFQTISVSSATSVASSSSITPTSPQIGPSPIRSSSPTTVPEVIVEIVPEVDRPSVPGTLTASSSSSSISNDSSSEPGSSRSSPHKSVSGYSGPGSSSPSTIPEGITRSDSLSMLTPRSAFASPRLESSFSSMAPISSLILSDTVTPSTANVPRWEETPDLPTNILLQIDPSTGMESVKSATIEKLIERLTYHSVHDANYMVDMFLTYRSFMSPKQLLQLLLSRFFVDALQAPVVRLRVCNCLKHWVEKHYYDFEDDEELRSRLLAFVLNVLPKSGMRGSEMLSAQLSRAIESQRLLCDIRKYERTAERLKKQLMSMGGSVAQGELQRTTWTQPPPPPLIPSSVSARKLTESDQFRLLDWDAIEIARQLCLLEFEIFQQIRPQECLNRAWVKDNKAELAPNVCRMIDRFNSFSHWISFAIMSAEIANRAEGGRDYLRKFIEIATECYELKNINAVMEIMGSLNSAAVNRLKPLWEALPPKTAQQYEALNQFTSMNGNFKRMREFMATVDPPHIPHIGRFLSDLTFVDEGNADSTNSLINFSKRQSTAQLIRKMQQFQQIPYHFQAVELLLENLGRLHCGLSDDSLYEMSKKVFSRIPSNGLPQVY